MPLLRVGRLLMQKMQSCASAVSIREQQPILQLSSRSILKDFAP
jgi:hypothetical protein